MFKYNENQLWANILKFCFGTLRYFQVFIHNMDLFFFLNKDATFKRVKIN